MIWSFVYILKYRTRATNRRSQIIAAPSKKHANFFYSIFKLQFDQRKGPILLMAAVISAARTVVKIVSKNFFFS